MQAEAALRQEVQAKLAEQLREADREKKALRDQLKGELRASRKEVAQLKGQVWTSLPRLLHGCVLVHTRILICLLPCNPAQHCRREKGNLMHRHL